MEIATRTLDGVIILDLGGNIDVNSANFVEIVGQYVHSGCVDILCNFDGVDSIDYMGMSVVVIAYKEVVNNTGRMKFCNVPTHLKNMLAIAGIDRVIEIYADEESARKSFKEDKVLEGIKKMQLRRRFKRLPVDIKVELKDQCDSCGSACIKAEIVNLSAIGAYVFGCDKFKLGDHLTVKLGLPPVAKELDLEAKVVWLPDRQVQPHFYPGIGIEFINVPGPAQQILIGFIERNLSFTDSDK